MNASAIGLEHNLLMLTGSVTKAPKLQKSPAGIAHLYFVLEHQSEQIEANLPRRSYLRIQAVLSGPSANEWSKQLNTGTVVTARGFLNREEDSNGVAKLVLHVQQLSLN